MANYASSVLLAARLIQQEKYSRKFEGRPVNSYLVDMLMKDRDITIPMLSEIRESTTQTTTILYPTKTAYTVNSAKSCSPTGEQGDSGSVNLTWATKQVEVIISEKRHKGNEIKMAQALAWELLMAEQAIWKDSASSVEAAIYAYLEANRTQVAASTGTNGTWDATNFNYDYALANINDFYNLLVDDLALNNYSGEMNEAFNTSWGSKIRYQANQGEANATNLAYQYNMPVNFMGYASNYIANASGDGSTHYIIPQGGVAILDWNDPLNRENAKTGDSEWSLYESRFIPGVMLDMFHKVSCSDTSGSGGGTQDLVHVFELSYNYAIAKQPLSTANATPIIKANILTT